MLYKFVWEQSQGLVSGRDITLTRLHCSAVLLILLFSLAVTCCGSSVPRAAESADEAHQQGGMLGADPTARGEHAVCWAGERRKRCLPGKVNGLRDGHAAYGGTDTLGEKLIRLRNEYWSFLRLPGVAKASLQEARAGCPGAKKLPAKAYWPRQRGCRAPGALESSSGAGNETARWVDEPLLMLSPPPRFPPCTERDRSSARETVSWKGGWGKRMVPSKCPWIGDHFGWL